MSPVEKFIKELRRDRVDIDDVRQERLLAGIRRGRIERKRRMDRRVFFACGAAAACLAFFVSIIVFNNFRGESSNQAGRLVVSNNETDEPIALSLGGRGRAVMDPGAAIAVRQSRPDEVEVEQTGGLVRYEVEKQPGRSFAVIAAGVKVEVIGTVFVVDMRAATVDVSVVKGRVDVSDGTRKTRIAASERISFVRPKKSFPPNVLLALRDNNTADESKPNKEPKQDIAYPNCREVKGLISADEESPKLSAGSESPKRPPLEPSQPPADRDMPSESEEIPTKIPGDFEVDDFLEREPEKEILVEPNSDAASASTKKLLAKIDDARAQKDYRRAEILLRQALERETAAPRRSSLLFTLGRVYAMLGEHLSAARSFSMCRTELPSGTLAEDALAEEVAARLISGQVDEARRLANSYLDKYPRGLHAKKMEKVLEPLYREK